MAATKQRESFPTDESVEAEIARLQKSEYVKLAKKEERVRNRRRQYMYTLRQYEKKGKLLAAEGVTLESLDHFGDCPEFDPFPDEDA